MIPVFEALIEDLESGIYKISLVDLPAVESDFIYFNKENVMSKFSIENEEQRMVTGVIMRADFPIYRYDEQFGEYYIKYSKDTIKKMAEKMMVDNTFNNINLQHIDGTDVEGVNLVELFIKDTSKGISPAGFEDIEDGSLFATYKINIDSIWEQIKLGTFRGFSLEGMFDIEPVKLRKQKHTTHNFMSTLFNRFLKSFVKCGSVETDKGTLYWVGEADLQIGDELFYNTENEEAVKVEDGEYTLKDGTVIVVTEGLVSEIREKDGEQEGELDMEDEKKDECLEEEEIIVEDPEDETKEEADAKYDELKAEIEVLKSEHDEFQNKIDEAFGMINDLKDALNKILENPAAEPIVEEFEKVAKIHTNDAKLNNALEIIGSVKKNKK